MICRNILHSFAFLPHYFVSMFHVPHKQEVEKRELESYKKDVEQAIKEKKEVTFSKDWLKNKDNELRMNRRLSREGKLKEQDMER